MSVHPEPRAHPKKIFELSMTLRVLHIINGDLYSGAERVQDLLALNLPKFGTDVGVVCVKPDRFPEQRQAVNTPIYLTPMDSRFDLRCSSRIAHIIRQGRYRVVHTHTPRAALVGRIASRLAGVPMVHHVHSPTGRDTGDQWRNLLNWQIEKWSLIGVSRIIPVSASLSRYLINEGFRPAKIRLVPNGVPTPGPLMKRPTPDGHWTVGMIALFRPRKGIDTLLKATSLLRASGKDIYIRAVGPFDSTDYQHQVAALSDKLGMSQNIDWVGFTKDISSELAKMDALVLPSLYGEGMPMVILEAMAAGVPVVASEVEGIPEVLAEGRCGILVPPGDFSALADKLCGLIEGAYDWQALRRDAYARQSELFSAESMARSVSQVYRELITDA
jgi:glycosyltransferase involved in cell wall biosynthesis